MSDAKNPLSHPTPYTGRYTTLESAQKAMAAVVHDASEGLINLVAPTMELHHLPPFKAIAITRVDPPASFEDAGLYKLPGGGGGKLGLPKAWLDKLKQLRGINIVKTERVDDGKLDAFWRFAVTVASPNLDGSVTTIQKSRELDLGDNAPELPKAAGKEMKPENIAQARANGPQICESKAQNRAVREALGINGSMRPADYGKPWIVVALVVHVDPGMISQQAKDDIAAAAILGDPSLYGRARARPQPAPPEPQGNPTTNNPTTNPANNGTSQQQSGGYSYSDDDDEDDGSYHDNGAAGDQKSAGGPPAEPDRPCTPAEVQSLRDLWGKVGGDKFRAALQAATGSQTMPEKPTLALFHVLNDKLGGGAPF